MLGVAGIPVVLIRVVGVPAGIGAEVELEPLPVAGGDAALEVGAAEGDGLLADAAFLPHSAILARSGPPGITLPVDVMPHRGYLWIDWGRAGSRSRGGPGTRDRRRRRRAGGRRHRGALRTLAARRNVPVASPHRCDLPGRPRAERASSLRCATTGTGRGSFPGRGGPEPGRTDGPGRRRASLARAPGGRVVPSRG